jgi:dTDP-4-dehydrorhamnose reductase
VKTLCITGGNGLLGNKLLIAAEENYSLVSIDIHASSTSSCRNIEYIQCSVTDSRSIQQTIIDEKPGCVLHTAAFTDVDGCERDPHKAWLVNVQGTENVANACRRLGIKMIHISTDYVFDGSEGPYEENQETNPISVYGKTKLESEKIIAGILEDFCIVRTMVLYGYHPGIHHNFVTWLVDVLRQGKPVSVVDDQFGTPTLADDLAKAILSLVAENKKGIYHAAGREWISRYEFALHIAEIFQFDKSLIRRTSSHALNQPAPRPLLSGLKIHKIFQDIGARFTSIKEGLEIVKSQMEIMDGDS